MPRSEIIRADSIDLQDHHAPSAQDHTRQPNHPAPLGTGPAAPHQAGTLREVAAETENEHLRSPRLSKEWSTADTQQLQGHGEEELVAGVTASLTGANLQRQDDQAGGHNGGVDGGAAEDAEMADTEGEDSLDDDMMDRISSSPSIDDGGYFHPRVWPDRCDSLTSTKIPLDTCSPSLPQACCESSSPFMETPDHFPLEGFDQKVQVNRYHHLLPVKYGDLKVTPAQGSQVSGDQTDQVYDFATPPMERMEPRVESYDMDFDFDVPHEVVITPAEPGEIGADQKHRGLRDVSDEVYEDVYEDDEFMTIPYESTDEEDDDYPYTADSRFVDSGWGGECLQDSEDIDFEFVYALHTFVATVEGQANATKGDTMVLLDDSNSYWWLVRVVKDSSIGYLPAEHIETPTERLARLNKHRNIDLTSAMLGDQGEKKKNPLKNVISRKAKKTVAFAAPTYVEASDIDYSSDEDENDGDFYGEQEQRTEPQQQNLGDDEISAVEPLKIRSDNKEAASDNAERGEGFSRATSDARSSQEIIDGKVESRSRNGTVRNTDSFFKDDTVETRKITITPNILRDDSNPATRTSNDLKELRQRASLEKLEKDGLTDKSKDKKEKKDKKDKEKKPGMLSGLFKRKDKKTKSQEEEVDELAQGKRSTENSRTSPVPSKDSEELVRTEELSQATSPDAQRQPSKTQKQSRTEVSPIQVQLAQGSGKKPNSIDSQSLSPDGATAANPVLLPALSLRMVQPDPPGDDAEQKKHVRDLSNDSKPSPALMAPKEKTQGTIAKILRTGSAGGPESRPVKAKKAKSRVELDDFDSSEEETTLASPTQPTSVQLQRPVPGAFPDSYSATPVAEESNPVDTLRHNDQSSPVVKPVPSETQSRDERLSESPVQISPISPSQVQSYLPALMGDNSSQEEPPSPVSSAPSTELIDAEDAKKERESAATSTSTSAGIWNDTNLRTFFDDNADIRDLLVVVYDKSGVVPAGPEHPITGNLFKEENAKLAEITNRLDGMLGDWLARKMRTQASR